MFKSIAIVMSMLVVGASSGLALRTEVAPDTVQSAVTCPCGECETGCGCCTGGECVCEACVCTVCDSEACGAGECCADELACAARACEAPAAGCASCCAGK